MQETFDRLSARLATSGLRILHSGPPAHDWPQDAADIKTVLIIGHAGSKFWPFFKTSPEFSDGKPDPLDRWSRRVIQAAATDLRFASPNDGPPYPPIHALTAGGALHPSPLGMLVHSQFGLWTAVRGLLLSGDELPLSSLQDAPPAEAFAACFPACPVSAFSDEGYDAAACARHLLSDQDAPCWQGCLARKACTVGAAHAYEPSHAKFYMDAFTSAMQRRGL